VNARFISLSGCLILIFIAVTVIPVAADNTTTTITTVATTVPTTTATPVPTTIPTTAAPPTPIFTGISPATGPMTGGTSVTITGSGFTGATSVTIGGAAATSFSVVSDTEITAITPAGTARTANVIIITPGGTATGTKAFTYSAPAPMFSSISPATGPMTGATSVTITGSGFTGATSVTIGGAAATGVTVVSDTSITATTPAGTAGTANVVIITPGGSVTGTGVFTYSETTSIPTFSSISPATGPVAGGTTVTITGTGFTGATVVTIGGTHATSVTVVSDTAITATTPAGTSGTANVVVVAPGGTAIGSYTYVTPAAPGPTFSGISPATGPVAGGTPVTLTGTGFTGATLVTIGGTAASSVTVVSNTTITATTPAGTAGTADIIIVAPGGTATGTDAFTYISPTVSPTATITPTPPVASFTVSWAATENTAPLTVQFTDASTNTPTSWNWIFGDGGTSSLQNPSYTYTTAGTYTASLIATNAAGSSSAYTQIITVSAAATTTVPAVTEISPTYGPVSTSTAITITGTGFTGATAVTVGGTAVTSFTVVSNTSITATTPASSTVGQVDVLVTTPSGTSASVAGDKYTFAATATTIPLPIFSASPTSGSAPLEVTFLDASTGSPASWDWDFGDGNTSTLENPTNTYVDDGTYSVTLTETNSIGTNSTTMTGYIVVGAETPVALFTESFSSGTAPLSVQFTDESTGSPSSWSWNFGNGDTSSLEDPTETYQSAGTYTITLTATNSEGSSTNSETVTVYAPEVVTTTTTIPLPVVPPVPTFAVAAEDTTESSVDNWLAQQQALITVTPTHKSPGYDVLSALIGCGAVAVIALRRRN